MRTTKTEEIERRNEAIKYLKKILKPGKTVKTIVRHVSGSGTSRRITCVIANKGEIQNIDWYVSKVTGYKRHEHGGIVVNGAGMDMGFSLVYTLGRYLYPNGFRLAKGQRGRNGDTSGIDTDGGYALHQEWL